MKCNLQFAKPPTTSHCTGCLALEGECYGFIKSLSPRGKKKSP